MTDGVISSIISGGVALLVCMLNNYAQTKKVEAQHDKTIALIDYRLTNFRRELISIIMLLKERMTLSRIWHCRRRE